jgi:crossover junction endodeoxyribonuclease RuvC
MTQIVGIDPGLSGALARLEAVDGAIALVDVIDMPIVGSGAKQSVDAIQLQEWLLRHGPRCAYLERSQAMPKQGASSGFKYGRAVGAIEATLAIRAVSIIVVEPGKWKRHFHLAGGDKEGARLLTIRLYPGQHHYFSRKRDHNRSEAVLIGLYGLQTSLQIKPASLVSTVTEVTP